MVMEKKELIEAAIAVRENAYAPFSSFKVGSAIEMEDGEVIEPRPVVIVEGILIFAEPRVLDLLDVRVFVDTPDDIRFIRRLQRDIIERGRTFDSVIAQYYATVRPMHFEFVEPSKRNADIIIPEGGKQDIGIEFLCSKIREELNKDWSAGSGQ